MLNLIFDLMILGMVLMCGFGLFYMIKPPNINNQPVPPPRNEIEKLIREKWDIEHQHQLDLEEAEAEHELEQIQKYGSNVYLYEEFDESTVPIDQEALNEIDAKIFELEYIKPWINTNEERTSDFDDDIF